MDPNGVGVDVSFGADTLHFDYDAVIGPYGSQQVLWSDAVFKDWMLTYSGQDVYELAAKPVVDDFLQGFNGTVHFRLPITDLCDRCPALTSLAIAGVCVWADRQREDIFDGGRAHRRKKARHPPQVLNAPSPISLLFFSCQDERMKQDQMGWSWTPGVSTKNPEAGKSCVGGGHVHGRGQWG